MLEQILELERNLFFILNGSDSIFLDNFMWLYSYTFTWIPFYFFLFMVFSYKKDWKEIVLTISITILLITLCNQISCHVIKPYFHRLRPTHHPDFKNEVDTVFNYLGGMYGFISGHATNSFGLATLTALLFRNKALTTMIFFNAFVTAYSRVYLGVHFISDIVAGTIVGTIIGLLIYQIYIWSRYSILKVSSNKIRETSYTTGQCSFLIIVYILIVALLLIFNQQLVDILAIRYNLFF